MAALDVVAGVLMLVAQLVLVGLAVRLARAAHRADDLGVARLPWAFLAAFAGFHVLSALLRVLRWATGSMGSMPELVLQLGAEVASVVFLVLFFRRAHAARWGAPYEGSNVVGVILVLTSLASTLAVDTSIGRLAFFNTVISLGTGLLAWAAWDAAAFVRADPRQPGWMSGLARVAAQAFVATNFLRAFAFGASGPLFGFYHSRLAHAVGFAIALALLAPALIGIARGLDAGSEERAPTGRAAADA